MESACFDKKSRPNYNVSGGCVKMRAIYFIRCPFRDILFKCLETLFYQVACLQKLLLIDSERRGKAYDVAVCRLCEYAVVAHLDADVPCFLAVLGLDNHRIEKSLAAHEFDHIGFDGFYAVAEYLSEFFGVLGEFLVADYLQRGDRRLGCDGVAAESGAVFAGLDGQHHLVVSEYRRYGEDAAAEDSATSN